MQAAGTTGILSGMSYSNVNNYVYAQSGQTIKVCWETKGQNKESNCHQVWSARWKGP